MDRFIKYMGEDLNYKAVVSRDKNFLLEELEDNIDFKELCYEVQIVLDIIHDARLEFSDKKFKILSITNEYPDYHPAKNIAYDYIYKQVPSNIKNLKH